MGAACRRARGRRLRAAPGASPPHQGDRLGRGENDAVDARTLAHLLRTGLLPEAYMPRASCATSSATGWRSPDPLGAQAPRRGDLTKQGVTPVQRHVRPGGLRFLAALVLAESPRRRLDSTLALIADFTRGSS